MENKYRIRENPLFEIHIENNHFIVKNADYLKDNCVINLRDISNLELIRNQNILEKFLYVYFGFYGEVKSNDLRIILKNGFKDIRLTDCDIRKIELMVYEVNQLIIKKTNLTNPI